MNRDEYNNNSGNGQVTTQDLVVEDFNKLVNTRQRNRFIKKIFNSDKQDYQKFIKLIHHINNWKDANILIDFYFYKNGVNPISKEALDFRNIIYFVYFPSQIRK
jgi:hypothetical protein